MNVVELNEWVVLVPTRAGGLCRGLKRAEGGRFGRWKPNAVGSLVWAGPCNSVLRVHLGLSCVIICIFSLLCLEAMWVDHDSQPMW